MLYHFHIKAKWLTRFHQNVAKLFWRNFIVIHKQNWIRFISLSFLFEGPAKIPLFGSLPFLPKKVKSGEIRMSTYMKEKYGPIAGMYAGTKPLIFITDFNLVKELYKVKEMKILALHSVTQVLPSVDV